MWSFQGEFAFAIGKAKERPESQEVVESRSQTERAFGFTPNPVVPDTTEEDKKTR